MCRSCAATDPVIWPRWPVFTCLLACDEKSCDCCCVQTGGSVSQHFSSQTLLNINWVLWILERRRARSSFSVCSGWYGWQRPLSRSAVLFATLWHWRELSDERYAHHIQFEFWLLRWLTLDVTDRPTMPAVRSVGVVYYTINTTRLLLSACCLSLATSFWWHSRFYTMLQTPFCLLYL